MINLNTEETYYNIVEKYINGNKSEAMTLICEFGLKKFIIYMIVDKDTSKETLNRLNASMEAFGVIEYAS